MTSVASRFQRGSIGHRLRTLAAAAAIVAGAICVTTISGTNQVAGALTLTGSTYGATVTVTAEPQFGWEPYNGVGRATLTGGTANITLGTANRVYVETYALAQTAGGTVNRFQYTGESVALANSSVNIQAPNLLGTAPAGNLYRLVVVAYECSGSVNFDSGNNWEAATVGACKRIGVLYDKTDVALGVDFTNPPRGPGAPTNIVAEGGYNSIRVTWRAPAVVSGTSGPADGYFINFINTTNTPATVSSTDCGKVVPKGLTDNGRWFYTTNLTCTFTGLPFDKDHNLSVYSDNTIFTLDNGGKSATLTGSRALPVAPVTPEVITVTAVPTNNRFAVVTVEWEPVFGATSYEMSFDPVGNVCAIDGRGGHVWTGGADGRYPGEGTTSCVLSVNLAYGAVRQPKIKAKNAAGDSVFLTINYTVPSEPSTPSVTGTPGDSAVNISWQSNANGSAITKYTVERSLDGANWTNVAEQTNATYTDTNVVNGTEYQYRVTAENLFGSSDTSTIMTATPYTRPAAPSNVTVEMGVTEAVVSWESGDDGGSEIIAYIVEMSANDGEWAEVIQPVAPTSVRTGVIAPNNVATSVTVPDLTQGVSYRFRVAAENAAGVGLFSDPSSPATPSLPTPATPSLPTPATPSLPTTSTPVVPVYTG